MNGKIQGRSLRVESLVFCSMDTQSLVSGLQAYRAQLEQVELTLQAGVDPSQQADLLQLQGDLQQLIELTESSLLSMQKSHLLSALDGSPASCPQDEYVAIRAAIGALSEDGQQVLTEECACVDGEQAATSSGEEGNESECADAASGVKVKAPYYSTWGTLEYHNAMIMESECTKDGKPGVRVLYLYPTHKAMKPCPYFLDGKCHYQTSCRFSHGQVVPLDELQDFLEPDVSSLGVDAPCLARHSDGIWYPARITDIDGGLYTVKFDSLLLKDCVLEADGIIPPLRGSDSSSSSEDEVDPLANYGFAKVLGGDEGSSTASCSSGFAGWEAHTRGIGSKLLAQMGYEFGKGLGRNAQGRVEPIQAVLLPKGKSLDACAVIKHRKRGKGQVPSKPRRHRRVKSAGEGCSTSSSRNIFDFLNEKLDGSSTSNLPGDAAGGMQRKGKEVYHASQDTKRALNVRLAKTTERIQQKQKEIGKLRESMARNLGRESVLSAQLQTRLSGALSDLRVLQQEERSLQREQKKAETHKKMTEF